MEFQSVRKKTVGTQFDEAIVKIMQSPMARVLEDVALPFVRVTKETLPGDGNVNHIEAIQISFDGHDFAEKIMRLIAEAPGRVMAGEGRTDASDVVGAMQGLIVEIMGSHVTTQMQAAVEKMFDVAAKDSPLRKYADVIPHGFFENGGGG